MRIIFSESNPDYKNYTFPYAVWAIPESQEEIVELYDRGFLPSRKPRFYLTRSTRITLKRFELTYRARRTLKACQDIEMTLINISDFVIDKSIRELCLQCAEQRFGEGVINEQRLNRMINPENATHIMHFTRKEKTVGLVTINTAPKIAHYNFAFYDITEPKKSLGTFMLTAIINYFHNRDCNYLYMGTCYGKKFLYKAHFEGFEFFNGAQWSSDMNELSFLMERPHQPNHLFESSDYLNTFHPITLDIDVHETGFRYITQAHSA